MHMTPVLDAASEKLKNVLTANPSGFKSIAQDRQARYATEAELAAKREAVLTRFDGVFKILAR